MSLEIYLVRHGQTQFNETGRIQGWCDSPLTQLGQEQAAQLGKRLAMQRIRFDVAYCSTLQRTIDTARIILQQVGQTTLRLQELDELREFNFGSFEGGLNSTLHEMIAKERGFASREEWLAAYRHGQYNMLAQSVHQLDPEQRAENEAAFLARLHQGFHKIVANSPLGSGRVARALVVSHGMAITGILKSINPSATLYQSVPNASVTQLRYTLRKGLEIVNIGGNLEQGALPEPTQVAKALKKVRLR